MGIGGAPAAGAAGRRRGRRRGGKAVMSEINVTPMVDVMLVLLIIFMVSAPLMTVGVPIDLPKTKAKSLDQDNQPLTLSVSPQGQVFLQNSEVPADQLVDKLKAVTDARGGLDERQRQGPTVFPDPQYFRTIWAVVDRGRRGSRLVELTQVPSILVSVA